MSFFERLEAVDPRVIYVLLFLVVAFPLLRPLGLPISLSPMTTAYFNAVEKLNPGDVAVISLDYGPASMAEQYPQTKATFAHVAAKQAKLVVVAFWAEAAPLGDSALKDVFGKSNDNPKYGTDFVHLGWVANGEVGMAAFGKDVHATCPKDYYGTSIDSIPMMKNIKTAKDFKLLSTIASGTPGVPEWLRQWQAPYGITTITALTAVSAPGTRVYFPSQIGGILEGLAGAAEYEVLLFRYGYTGTLAPPMDAQSLSHVMVIIFIALGNIGFLLRRKKKAK